MAGPDVKGAAAGGTAGLAVGALLVNALVWGVSWWPFRELERHGLHPLWATAIIYTFSLACLLLVRPGAFGELLRHPSLWLLAVAAGLSNVGFNWAVTTGDVVRVVLLFYLMPAWVVLLAWPLLGERPGAGSLLRLALALGGLAIVLKTPDSPWPVPDSLADWLALMGGFSFALTNILLRRLNQTPGAARILAMFGGGMLMAAGVALTGTVMGLIAVPPAPGSAWVGVAALISLAFLSGNLALQYGASRLRASTTSLVMLSEVVFASASSVLLGASELSNHMLLGGGLILLAVLLSTRSSQTD
ncbi:MAG: DMT family transporter [Polaromonas sp.]|nr:DMT family transporter [Polaromonas sp.]